jgi:hypothetical protein
VQRQSQKFPTLSRLTCFFYTTTKSALTFFLQANLPFLRQYCAIKLAMMGGDRGRKKIKKTPSLRRVKGKSLQ